MKSIKLSSIISAIFIALNLSVSSQIEARNPDGMEVIDRVVAQVGGSVILYSDIEMQKMQALAQDMPMTENIDCRILEELLYQNLLLDHAKEDSIDIPENQVDADMENRLRNIQSQIGGRDKLEEFYGKTYREIKDEFRDIIKDQLLAQEMEKKITSDIRVTPRDVKRFFESIPRDSLPTINEQVALQQIVVYPKVTDRDRDKAITQLNKWRNDILRGTKSFQAIATMHSDDPGSAKQGGKIEASRGMMVKPFEAAAFSLNVGEISEVVETQYGFHIIQLLDRKGDDYVVRHILKIPEVDRSAFSQAAMVIDEAARKLGDGEISWPEAVTTYSEDEMTAQNQGNLVNPMTGELNWDLQQLKKFDPQVFELLQRMEVGGLTEPIIYQNPFNGKEGVRIVRLNKKIPPHQINMDQDYNFIKRVAENQKKEEAIEKWVNENSSKTFIKIDDRYSFCKYLYNW